MSSERSIPSAEAAPDVPVSSGDAQPALRLLDTPPPSPRDPVLDLVRFLAGRWQKSTSPDVLVSGLPLVAGRLPLEQAPAALDRVGITAIRLTRSLADLTEFQLPAIVADLGGRGPAIILEKRGGGRFAIYQPALGEKELTVPANVIQARQTVFHVAPQVSRPTGAAGGATAGRHWFRSLLSGHWKSAFHVVLAAVFINVFAVAFPLFSLNVYDRVLPNAATATLWVLTSGLALVLLFDFFLKIARGAIIDYVGRRIDLRLSSDLFARVVNTRIESRPASTGEFINRIGQYEILRDFMTSSTLAIFVDLIFVGVFALVIASLVGWVVLFPLVAGVLSVAVTLVIGVLSGRAVKAAQAEAASRNAILVEALAAPQTVKATRAEGELLRRWQTTVMASSKTQNTIKWYQSVATNFTATTSQVSMIAIIVAGTYLFAAGEISMGAIIASMMLSNRLIAPIGQAAGILVRGRSALEAYQTLGAVMALPDERQTSENFVSRQLGGGGVEFRNVRFAYPGSNQFVLDGINLSVKPGEKVGIIGRIGSGKTTLGRLLVNFYTPNEGEILLDGVAITQYHPSTLRREVGLLIQEPELFAGTVRENILMADPTADEQRLLGAAQRAGVDRFVARHPAGFDMPVGERGCLLSGGQRQAVALARTMLSDPKVLFLDEPTSSMDLASERQLIGHLGASMQPNHTVLIATHRYSLLSLVSRLIVIDNGRIKADGPRDQVLKQLQGEAAQ